jgi:hypothetical protein
MTMAELKPEPSLSDLRHLLKFHWDDPGADFYKSWLREGDSPLFLSRSGWAMAAVADAVELSIHRKANVLIPEYFCDQALWPLRSRGHHLHFFPVDQKARPDWDQLKAFEDKTDIFILPHFCGHANDALNARAFCDRAGAILIEDGAQAIAPAPGIGELADIVLYSPWKFFPIPNGSVLVIRPTSNIAAEKVADCAKNLGSASSPGLNWLKQGVLAKARHIMNAPAPLSTSGEGFFDDVATVPLPVRPRAAPFVLPLLAALDVAGAADRRRQNDAAIRAFFSGVDGWEPWFPTPSPGPFKSAFRVENSGQLLAAYRALRSAGIIAEGWPGLPPEVDRKSSAAGALRAKILLLPCHQGLTPAGVTAALASVDPSVFEIKQ